MPDTETETETRTEAPVVVVVPGDLHLTEPGLENQRAANLAVDEINGWVRPDFVQFIGDNVQDATDAQFLLFDALRGRLNVPHFAMVGDHDVKGDPSAEGFRRHVGDPFGSFRLRGFRFVRLNTQEARPLGLSDGQIRWFRDEIEAAHAGGERLVVFQHNYPYQIWETFDGPGIDDWRSLVQTRRVEAIISGHTHYWQLANDGRNVMVAVRSIGDPEGGPPGYAVLVFNGDDFAVTYRDVGQATPLVLITHPRERLLATGPKHVVRGPDRVEVRVWSPSPVDSVFTRVDAGDWERLEPRGEGVWEGRVSGDRLTKGEHVLDARAVSTNGLEATQRIGVMVDPTGRYTAVPEVRPVVTATDFC